MILAAPLAAILLPVLAVDPPLSIRTVAPKSAAFVLGADDLSGTWKRFKETSLWGLWSSEQMQEALKPALDEMKEGFAEAAKELGRPDDSMSMPASIGVAVFTELDEELGFERPHVMAFVDWGDDAGSLAMMDAMIEKGEKAGDLVRGELRGEPSWTMTLVEEDEEVVVEEDEFGDPMAISADEMFDFASITITKRGSRHLLASDTTVIEGMIDAIEGKATGEMLGGSEDFRDTMELLGSPDVYAAIFTSNLQKMLATGDQAFMLAMAQPILSKVFGDIRSHAMGVRVADGGIDQRLVMTVPGPKVGLLSLLTMDTPIEAPPAMLPADAVGYGRMNIRFDAIMPTIREIAAGLGEMEREQIEQMLTQMGPMLEQAFGAMGPSVQVMSTVRMPIDVDSMETTIAIPCTDLTRVEPMIAMMAPGMGLMRRDFQGQAIYSDEFSPMAIGMGQGHLFVGPSSAVERALRGPAADDGGMAATPEGKALVESLGTGRVVGFGFMDIVGNLRVQQAMMKDLMGSLDDMDLPGGDAGAGQDADGSSLPSIGFGDIDYEKALDPDLWSQYVGLAVWDFTAAEKGFVMRTRNRPPAGK